jgi:hypothetical protein
MSKFDKQRQRLADIFGTEGIPAVKTETLERYLDHLKQSLEFPCQLTGIEDFPWDAIYVVGPGDKEEHAQLRQTQPSYLDTYELLSFDDMPSRFGIMVHVRRVSDKKTFVLPLADLESTNKKSKNQQFFTPYSDSHHDTLRLRGASVQGDVYLSRCISRSCTNCLAPSPSALTVYHGYIYRHE